MDKQLIKNNMRNFWLIRLAIWFYKSIMSKSNKKVFFILVMLVMLPMISATPFDNVVSFWEGKGLSTSQAQEIANGSPSQETLDLANDIQEKEKQIVNETTNETKTFQENFEKAQRNFIGLVFIGGFAVVMFGFLLYLVIAYGGAGGKV